MQDYYEQDDSCYYPASDPYGRKDDPMPTQWGGMDDVGAMDGHHMHYHHVHHHHHIHHHFHHMY